MLYEAEIGEVDFMLLNLGLSKSVSGFGRSLGETNTGFGRSQTP